MKWSTTVICCIAAILQVSNIVLTQGPGFSPDNILKTEDIESKGWQMMFRANSGNGDSVYDAWTKGTKVNPDKPASMKRSHGLHYLNSSVINWSRLGIEQVKFAFYDEHREVAHVIFDGRGSTITNWFDRTNVLYSSWPDLTSNQTYNYFSIHGHYDSAKHDRRFFINRSYKGCPNDLGHMVVINSKSPAICKWDDHAAYPQFLYSKISTVDYWNRRRFGTADFMAIFIKTRV